MRPEIAHVGVFFNKSCFLLTHFFSCGAPLIFDDQFSTRFAIMFPQSLNFYILIRMMAVLNLRQYMLFAQLRSLFSGWQDKLLKSQSSAFLYLFLSVLLWGESLAREAVSTCSSGACDRAHLIVWLNSASPWCTFWDLLSHPSPNPLALLFPSCQSPPKIPFTFQSPTQTLYSSCSEIDKHAVISRQRMLWRGKNSRG